MYNKPTLEISKVWGHNDTEKKYEHWLDLRPDSRDASAIYLRCRRVVTCASREHRVWVPGAPHPDQHLVLSVFVILDILVEVEWHLIMAFICISLMTNDIEHLFMCIFFFCHLFIFFIEMSVQISCPCFHWVFEFLSLSCKSYLYILMQVPFHIYVL